MELVQVEDRHPDPTCRWVLYRISGAITMLHIVDVTRWVVIPSEACSPLKLRLHGAHRESYIYLKQSGEPVSLLQYALSTKNKLTLRDLQKLADLVGCDRNSARAKQLETLCDYVCAADGILDAGAFKSKCLDSEKKAAKENIDIFTEFCYDELDVDDKQEFGLIQKRLNYQKTQRRIAQWQKERKKSQLQTPKKKRKVPIPLSACKFAKKAKTTTGSASSGSGGSGGGGGGGPITVDPAPVDPVPPGPLAVDPAPVDPVPPDPPAPPAVGTHVFKGRRADTFRWRSHSNSLVYHFTRTNRTGTPGVQVLCPLHAKQVPLNSTSGNLSYCTRELLGEEDDVVRRLKTWCVQGALDLDRNSHFQRPRRIPDPEVLSDHELDTQLELLAGLVESNDLQVHVKFKTDA